MTRTTLLLCAAALLLGGAGAACERPNDAELCRANHPDGGCTLHIVCGADCAEGELTRDARTADPADSQCAPNTVHCL